MEAAAATRPPPEASLKGEQGSFSPLSTVGELIYAWKKVRLKSRLGSNLTFFPGSVNLDFFTGSNLKISY